METEREDDSGAPMHPPEERADLVLRLLLKFQIPEQQLPVKCVALTPERCTKQPSIRFVASRHESLQMMARYQFMKDGGSREGGIVATHAHHLLFMRHCVCRIRNQNCFASEEERANQLPLRSHHFHPPGIARELRHRYQIVVVDKLDCFKSEISDQLRLLSRFHISVLYMLECFLPVIAVTQLARGLLHFIFAPGEFFVRNSDQLLGCVGNHFRLQFAHEGIVANRIAHNVAGVARSSTCRARTLKATAAALAATSSTSGHATASGSPSALLSGLACAAGGAESHYSFTQE